MDEAKAGNGAREEVERLERAFWQALAEGRPAVAAAMFCDTALMVGGHGTMAFDPVTYERMASNPQARVLDYRLSDFEVLLPREDVAIVAYKAWQKYVRNGETIEQDVVDSSTWVRIGGEWKCAAHTESAAPPVRQ